MYIYNICIIYNIHICIIYNIHICIIYNIHICIIYNIHICIIYNIHIYIYIYEYIYIYDIICNYASTHIFFAIDMLILADADPGGPSLRMDAMSHLHGQQVVGNAGCQT